MILYSLAALPRVYLKSQKEGKDESNVEKKWYNKVRRK